MRRTYLGHAATTPARPEAAEAMLPYCTEAFGNPPSIYFCGQQAKGTVEEATLKLAEFICARCEQIVFTSVGTGASDCTMKGLICRNKDHRNTCSVFGLSASFPSY